MIKSTFWILHVAIFILYPVSYIAYFCKLIEIYHLLSLRRFAANIFPHVFSDWYSDKSSMHIKLKNICTDYDNSEKSDYKWHFVYIANDQKLYFLWFEVYKISKQVLFEFIKII